MLGLQYSFYQNQETTPFKWIIVSKSESIFDS